MHQIHLLQRRGWNFEGLIPFLTREGFLMSRNLTAKAIIKTIDNKNHFLSPLLILDLDCTEMDTALRCQRRSGFSPLIMALSRKTNENWMIDALNAGADDCLFWPTDLKVLLSKINALSRREDRCLASKKNEPSTFSWGKISFSSCQERFVHRESNVSLTPLESRLLKRFLETPGRLVSKEELLRSLWQHDSLLKSNNLAVHITSLRKKLRRILSLDPSNPPEEFLETFWRLGYRLRSE